jgi:integrase
MASLILQKGSYYAQFYDSGKVPKRKQVPLRTKREKIAEKLFHRLEDDHALGRFDPWAAPRASPTYTIVGEAASAFIETRSHLRPETVSKYRMVLTLFAEHVGLDMPLDSIGSEHVQRFLFARQRKPVTRKTYSTTLSPFFNWLIEGGLLTTNPVKAVRLERVPNKHPRFLTRSNVDALVEAVATEVRDNTRVPAGSCLWLVPIIRANVYLGLRASEVCNLRWGDVDLDRHTLTVANREGFETKSGRDRTLPLAEPPLRVLEGLDGARLDRDPEGFVFKVSPDARQLRRLYLSKRFKHFAQLAKLPDEVNFHTTRHTCASWLAMKGCPVEAIRLYLGHSSITVTQRYMHLSPDGLASQITAAFAAS